MQHIRPNRLRLARKGLGCEQKQIAKLLGYSLYEVSRYETGQRLPGLKTALKLSIIYKLPLRVLFHIYFEECRAELIGRAHKFNKQEMLNIDLTEPTDYCSYLELVNSAFMTDIDKEKVRRHIKQLMDDRRTKILGD